MKNACFNKLAFIASYNIQNRYIINGTKDRYLLPEELIDELYHCLKLIFGEVKRRKVPTSEESFSDNEKHHLFIFFKIFKEEFDNLPLDDVSVSNKELIEECYSWKRIREAARECLEKLNFDLINWEKKILELEKNK